VRGFFEDRRIFPQVFSVLTNSGPFSDSLLFLPIQMEDAEQSAHITDVKDAMVSKCLGCLMLLIAVPMAWGQKPDLPLDEATAVSNQETDPPLLPQPEKAESGPAPLPLEAEPNPELEEVLEAEENHSSHRLWFRAEYLLWWIKDSNIPPLLTTGPATDPRPGALDSSNTSILFGGGGQDNKNRSGGRFFAGCWLTDEDSVGVEAGYFFLGPRAIGTFESSPGNPVRARPFVNVNAGMQDSSLVAYPGLIGGSVRIQAPSFLQGAEANMVTAVGQANHLRLEAFLGFRYLNLGEGLHIDENDLVSPMSPQLPGQPIPISDRFDVQNNFFGGQLGARADFRWKRCTLNILAKVALGETYETVSIHGSTQIGTRPAVSEGFLALSSNSGRFSHNGFTVVPEVNVSIGFQITESLRAFAGYSFLYWSQVARPGDQVDLGLNENLVPTSTTIGAGGGLPRPAFAFHTTDFWAHGINLGLEFRF